MFRDRMPGVDDAAGFGTGTPSGTAGGASGFACGACAVAERVMAQATRPAQSEAVRFAMKNEMAECVMVLRFCCR